MNQNASPTSRSKNILEKYRNEGYVILEHSIVSEELLV